MSKWGKNNSLQSTDSENLERFMFKGQSHKSMDACTLRATRWYCIKNDTILWLRGLSSTSRNHCSPCRPQMQVRALSCKEEAIWEHGSETPPSSQLQRSFKMVWGKVEELFCDQNNLYLKVLLENMNPASSRIKSVLYKGLLYEHFVQMPVFQCYPGALLPMVITVLHISAVWWWSRLLGSIYKLYMYNQALSWLEIGFSGRLCRQPQLISV